MQSQEHSWCQTDHSWCHTDHGRNPNIILGVSPKTRKSSTMSFRIALEMKCTRTSFTIFVVYVLCWGWLGMFYLVDNLCGKCISTNKNLSVHRMVVKAVSFTSSVFLPLVCCLKTKTFRKELKRLTVVRYIVALLKEPAWP